MNNSMQKNMTMTSFFFLWFGAAISIAEIMTGGLLTPLGFSNGLMIIFLGHAIGTTILVLGGVIGSREGLPAISSTRISFGLYGTYLFSILNVLQLIGWTAVMIISGARSINSVSTILWSFDNMLFWSVVIGLLIGLWILLGNTGFKRLNVIAVSLLFGLTIILSWVIFHNSKLFTTGMAGGLSFGTGLELNIIMPLSWLPLIADYTRFAKNGRAGFWGPWLGYFIGSSWMYIIGLGAGIVSGNADPTAMMLAANLGLTALGIVLLSTVTTTFLDVYSAGVTFLNITGKWSERTVAIVMTAIGTVIAIFVPIEQYENFLYAIGSVFAPLFAVVLADYFVIKSNRQIQETLLVNWGSTVVWAIGVGLYYYFVGIDFVLGATLPVMLLTGLFYTLTWRWTDSWKYSRPSATC